MKKLILILLVISFSCTEATKELTDLWIHSYKVNCEGSETQLCMQIQESEDIDPEAWQLFNGEIECFKHEEGVLYQVHVVKKTLPDAEVPADGSSIQFKLVNIISQVKQNTNELNAIWQLTELEGEAVDTTGLTNLPTIEFILNENAVSGTDGCNRLNGNIKLLDNSRLEFMPFAATRMMCPGMAVPDKFGALLSQTASYNFDNEKLVLLNANNMEIMSFKKSE